MKAAEGETGRLPGGGKGRGEHVPYGKMMCVFFKRRKTKEGNLPVHILKLEQTSPFPKLPYRVTSFGARGRRQGIPWRTGVLREQREYRGRALPGGWVSQ